MADSGHFVKNIKFRIDMKWPEMRSKEHLLKKLRE